MTPYNPIEDYCHKDAEISIEIQKKLDGYPKPQTIDVTGHNMTLDKRQKLLWLSFGMGFLASTILHQLIWSILNA